MIPSDGNFVAEERGIMMNYELFWNIISYEQYNTSNNSCVVVNRDKNVGDGDIDEDVLFWSHRKRQTRTHPQKSLKKARGRWTSTEYVAENRKNKFKFAEYEIKQWSLSQMEDSQERKKGTRGDIFITVLNICQDVKELKRQNMPTRRSQYERQTVKRHLEKR